MTPSEIRPHPFNDVPLYDKEWYFMLGNRPAKMKLREGNLKVWIGDEGKKIIYDGQFYESLNVKILEERPTLGDLLKELEKWTVTIGATINVPFIPLKS